MWDLGSRQVIRTFTTNKGPITYAAIIAKPFSEDMNIDDRQPDKVHSVEDLRGRCKCTAGLKGGGAHLLLAPDTAEHPAVQDFLTPKRAVR